MSNRHPTTYPRRPHTQFKTIFHLSNPNKIAVKIPNRLRHKKLKHELSPNLPRTQRELSPNRAELSPNTPRTNPNQPKLKPNQSRRHPVPPPPRRRPLRPHPINRSTTILLPTSNPPTKPISKLPRTFTTTSRAAAPSISSLHNNRKPSSTSWNITKKKSSAKSSRSLRPSAFLSRSARPLSTPS